MPALRSALTHPAAVAQPAIESLEEAMTRKLDFGVYADVVTPGTVSVGDAITPVPA